MFSSSIKNKQTAMRVVEIIVISIFGAVKVLFDQDFMREFIVQILETNRVFSFTE